LADLKSAFNENATASNDYNTSLSTLVQDSMGISTGAQEV
jgi:hypothetical protein